MRSATVKPRIEAPPTAAAPPATAPPGEDVRRGRPGLSPAVLALVALSAAGAAIRFATLGEQSFSLDETFTVHLTRISFGAMLHQLPRSESTPPLHYLLVWGWSRVFGTSEAGLRSLSALFGTLTIPMLFALGRRAFSPRAGLIAAALATVSPILVWYSQEARSYALLVLLASVSLYFFVRALEERSSRMLVYWSVSASLSLLTHYFALFVIIPQAAWLLLRSTPRRPALLACGGPALVALALAPLAYAQRHPAGGWSVKWITPSEQSLAGRIARIPRELLLGYKVPAGKPLAILLGALFIYALWSAVRNRDARARLMSWTMISIALVGIAIPVAAAVASPQLDLILTRFFLPSAVPLLLVLAAGLAIGRGGRPATLAFAGIWLAMVVAVDLGSAYQRPDIRGAIHALGTARTTRLVIVTGDVAQAALAYLPDAVKTGSATSEEVAEIDVVAMPPPGATRAPQLAQVGPPEPGFEEIARRGDPGFTVLRFRAAAPERVRFHDLAPGVWRGWNRADLGVPPLVGGLLQYPGSGS